FHRHEHRSILIRSTERVMPRERGSSRFARMVERAAFCTPVQEQLCGRSRPSAAHRLEGMASSPYSCVLWDVDGTIVDASVGILRRLNVALTHFGRPAPTREELIHWIGPP